MSDQPVVLERTGEVAVVRLAGGARGDLLDQAAWDALRRASLQLSDAPPRVAILSGAPSFSRGLDPSAANPIVRDLERLGRGSDTYRVAERLKPLREILLSFSRVPCPVIAAVEGPCLGAGFELALAADLRIAGRDARFGLPEIRWGMTPLGGGLVHLHRLLGPARANEIVLTGRTLDADTALAWGLLNRVVEAGHALDAALELANELTRSSRQAVLQATIASRALSRGTADAFDLETEAAARAIVSGTLEAGLPAWRDARPPTIPRGPTE